MSLRFHSQRMRQSTEAKRKHSYNTGNILKTNRLSKTVIPIRRKYSRIFTIEAPIRFSFVDSPSEIIAFLNRLNNTCAHKAHVVIDFQRVEHMAYCASIMLSSKLLEHKSFTHGARISMLEPQAPHCQHIWRQAFLNRKKPSESKKHLLYQDNLQGRQSHKCRKVDGELAGTLVREAMRYLSNGELLDHSGAYRIITECMANTFKHANPKEEAAESWYIASYAHIEPTPKRWCFAFVDHGVGILKSLQHRVDTLGHFSSREALQQVLEGYIGSRLDEPYRGKGLPGIYTELKRGRIKNLVVITNNVWANLATKEFALLARPFFGTFVHWELSSSL